MDWLRLPRGERGSATLEVVILGPGLLLFIGLIVYAGRVQIAGQSVQQAAEEAARAASIERTQATADQVAGSAARRTLSQQDLDCVGLSVQVDTSGFAAPAGEPASVTAAVTCTVRTGDLSLPGVPGTKLVEASAVSPLDTYRER